MRNMKEMAWCKLCSCHLNAENRHFVHHWTCKSCVSRRMHEGRQAKRDVEAELEVRRSIQIEIRGNFCALQFCVCGIPLLPFRYYDFDPRRCKECFIKDQWKDKMRTCKTCAKDIPKTDFIEGNRSTCRDCIKKHKAQRYQVLKACRDEATPSI
jgi:hypothetical protein